MLIWPEIGVSRPIKLTEQGGFPAAAAAQDDEDVPALDLEARVTEQRGLAVAHAQLANRDHRFGHKPNTPSKTVNRASSRMSVNRIDTTALVVRRPTPSAPPVVANPC